MDSFSDLKHFHDFVRSGQYNKHTSGIFPEKAQANIVITQKRFADDFALFCKKNPKPCPVIYRSGVGKYHLSELGDIDIRTDVPAYYVYENGRLLREVSDITDLWQDDFVCFCIGCSFTFDNAFTEGGIRLKHVEEGKNVAMYKTNIRLESTEFFRGKMVTSMRWITKDRLDQAIALSSKYPDFHGAPVHIGEPEEIGIIDLEHPDYGDFVPPEENDIPVFWGCGVTPQACFSEAKIPLAITHRPGSMLITDLTHSEVIQKTIHS